MTLIFRTCLFRRSSFVSLAELIGYRDSCAFAGRNAHTTLLWPSESFKIFFMHENFDCFSFGNSVFCLLFFAGNLVERSQSFSFCWRFFACSTAFALAVYSAIFNLSLFIFCKFFHRLINRFCLPALLKQPVCPLL